jgi:hypothetical protein
MSKPHTLEFFKDSHKNPGSICKGCTGPRDAELALKRWRARGSIASGGNEAWAKEQLEYYYSEGGQRSYRNTHLKRNFGITLEQFEEMLRAQGGVCALCSTDKPKGRGAFHVDHDHLTGLIRGLLCHACNSGLGSLGDDPVRVARAVKHLRGERLDYRPTGAPFVPDHRRYRDSELRKVYGISLAEYTDRLVLQKGACAICQSTAPRGRTNAKGHSSFHVDHDHTSGVFRGLLCHECNVGIGSLRDDPMLLGRAVVYLRESFSGLPLVGSALRKCEPKSWIG